MHSGATCFKCMWASGCLSHLKTCPHFPEPPFSWVGSTLQIRYKGASFSGSSRTMRTGVWRHQLAGGLLSVGPGHAHGAISPGPGSAHRSPAPSPFPGCSLGWRYGGAGGEGLGQLSGQRPPHTPYPPSQSSYLPPLPPPQQGLPTHHSLIPYPPHPAGPPAAMQPTLSPPPSR